MPIKKQPSPAQLAARKKFAAMAKSGELMKKRKAAAKKKTGLKKPIAKKVVATRKTTKCETPSAANLKLRKLAYNSCGRLRPGWKALKCGSVKFVGTAKKTTKKGLNGTIKTNKYLVKFWKDKKVIKETPTKTKAEALVLKSKYLKSFHISKRVSEYREATISKI